jgi:hypothetical protein
MIQTKLAEDRVASFTQPTEEMSTSVVGDGFYHSRGGSTFIAHASFVRSVSNHMLAQDKRLFEYFKGWHRVRQHRDLRHDPSDLQYILYNIREAGEDAMLILDALYEAEDTSVMALVRELIEVLSSRLRFIVVSRNDSLCGF